MKNPFAADDIIANEKIKSTDGLIEISMDVGTKVMPINLTLILDP